MAEELLCRHCHKRIHAAYSGATCPDCGAQLNGRTISHDSPRGRVGVGISVASRRKAWAAFALIMAGLLLALSLPASSVFVGVARLMARVVGLISLAFILAVLTRRILFAAAQRRWSTAAKLALGSVPVLMSVSALILVIRGLPVPASVALQAVPAVFLVSAIYVMISKPNARAGSLAHIALAYVLLMFAVIWLWAHYSFRYTHETPYDRGLFRGFGIAALIFAGLVLAIHALFKAWKDPHARKRAVAALMLVIVQTPVASFIVVENLTWRYPDWYESRMWGDVRNISTAILLFSTDTGTPPIYASADHSPESRVDYLYGSTGGMPGFTEEARDSWGSRAEDMGFILVTNGRNGPWYRYGRDIPDNPFNSHRIPAEGWAGPYLPYVTDDPWGYAYVVSVNGFEGGTKPDNHVWCLCAGPDHIVDTPAWAKQTHGDDIGYRTK